MVVKFISSAVDIWSTDQTIAITLFVFKTSSQPTYEWPQPTFIDTTYLQPIFILLCLFLSTVLQNISSAILYTETSLKNCIEVT